MAIIKLFTRTSKKQGELATIYLRLKQGRQIDLTVKAGIQIRPEHFNNKTGKIRHKADFKDKSVMDKRLRDLKNHVQDELIKLTFPPDKTWLVNTIETFHNPLSAKGEEPVTLFTFIRDFIDKAPTRITPKTGNPVCYKQIREYERTFHYLKGYAEKKDTTVDFKDITLDFYHSFMEYMQELKLAKNTIGKKIQTLKIFLNAATDQGINTNNQYKSHRFTAVSEETESIYLDETELQILYELDLSENPRLDRVRDLFMIGCWTGLRYSDWDKVKPQNIEDGFLELKQSKTGGAVVIPVHPTVSEIIEKYKGELPKVLSNQKFNDYLKEVARKAKLREKVHKSITRGGVKVSTTHVKADLVTTHTGRRSFATNLYKAGLPTLTIMQITGHRTEQAFLKYIRVTPREHAEKLRLFWQERTKLKVV